MKEDEQEEDGKVHLLEEIPSPASFRPSPPPAPPPKQRCDFEQQVGETHLLVNSRSVSDRLQDAVHVTGQANVLFGRPPPRLVSF